MKSSKAQWAYVVFPVIYGYWKLDEYPGKDWKKCDYCFSKYGVGGTLPYGYGDCKSCKFTTETLQYLDSNEIRILSIFIEVEK